MAEKTKAGKKKAADSAVLPAPEFPLLTYLDSLVESLRGYVPRAIKDFDEVAIHQARVMTRRLKAAIDLMAPLISKDNRKDFNIVLRNLRRTLGPMRDMDVMISRLCAVPADDPHRDAATWLVTQLTHRRVAIRKSVSERPPAAILGKLGIWWGLREEIIGIREAIDTVLAESVHLQLDAFVEQADEVTGVPVIGGTRPDPHELRIAGKALRYTLDMASESGHPLPSQLSKSFKQMQEMLGQWHDHVVLAERTMQVMTETMLTLHDTALAVKVLDLTRHAVESAGKHMDEFSTTWKSKGEDLAKMIREAFPLTKRLSSVSESPGVSADGHALPTPTATPTGEQDKEPVPCATTPVAAV